jgi:hypothetical protein
MASFSFKKLQVPVRKEASRKDAKAQSKAQEHTKKPRIGGAAVSGRPKGWRAGTPAPLHGGPSYQLFYDLWVDQGAMKNWFRVKTFARSMFCHPEEKDFFFSPGISSLREIIGRV